MKGLTKNNCLHRVTPNLKKVSLSTSGYCSRVRGSHHCRLPNPVVVSCHPLWWWTGCFHCYWAVSPYYHFLTNIMCHVGQFGVSSGNPGGGSRAFWSALETGVWECSSGRYPVCNTWCKVCTWLWTLGITLESSRARLVYSIEAPPWFIPLYACVPL